jgi:phage shock protein A
MKSAAVQAALAAASTCLGVLLAIGTLQERAEKPSLELALLKDGQRRLEVRLDRLEQKIDEIRKEANERERKYYGN